MPELDSAIVERARHPFPAEPVRTLDAIHLATAALALSLVPEMAVLSLDRRMRASAREMGFRLLPERTAGD
jgi:hypothetical protein